jgi:hypothetical protein
VQVKFNRGLLLAFGLVIVAVSAAALVSLLGGDSGTYALSVMELHELDPSSTTQVRVVGRITDEGVSYERYGFAEFSITDEGGGGRELPVSVDRSVFSISRDLDVGAIVVITGHLRGRFFEASAVIMKQTRGYRPVPESLTRMSLEDQVAAINGCAISTLSPVSDDRYWLHPRDILELYEDGAHTQYVWDSWFNVVRDVRVVDEDPVPTRVYPGEASFEECMERADALAREHYTGRADFDVFRRTTSRRIMEGVTNGPINYYDVTYQRYVNGMPVKDMITVTVYALSGGSDFVGIQIDGSEVPTDTARLYQPAISLERAISIAAQELEVHLQEGSANRDPEGWTQGHPSLMVPWEDQSSLVWTVVATWEDPDPDPNVIRIGGPPMFTVTIDAVSGEIEASAWQTEGLESEG